MLNQIGQIDPEKGDYILLEDFREEGIQVVGQYQSASEAIENCGGHQEQSLVKLVRFDINVRD